MGYEARILADSFNEATGDRLTTVVVTYPRFVHSELLTHRLFSRNSASSRAIPNEKLRKRIQDDPVLPVWWGKNQPGMQAREELEGPERDSAIAFWLQARDEMLWYSERLASLGVHKQICNRLLEPWMYITVVVTATEWDNFWHLRCHPDAQPEIKEIAEMAFELYKESDPIGLQPGEWHIPYGDKVEGDPSFEDRLKVSVARCARVSYFNHDGTYDLEADLKLYTRLADAGHWSPFEHQAEAMTESFRWGNLFGWRQYRKNFSEEHYGRQID